MKNLAPLLLLLVTLIFIGHTPDRTFEKSPNILFLAVDDLNDWNGVLKAYPGVKTPNLDRLATNGMVFTNAHCAAPACRPSRSAILSGIRPSTSGNYLNEHSFSRNAILNQATLLPEFFQKRGYYVIGSGKLFHGKHFINEIKGRGFNEYCLNNKTIKQNI